MRALSHFYISNELEGFHTLVPITYKKINYQHVIEHLVSPNEHCEVISNMFRTSHIHLGFNTLNGLFRFSSRSCYMSICPLHIFFCFHFILFLVSCKEARHIVHSHEKTQNRSKFSINFQAEYEAIHFSDLSIHLILYSF